MRLKTGSAMFNWNFWWLCLEQAVWLSPVFCLFQGHRGAGAIPDHHNRLLQGSDGRSRTGDATPIPGGWAVTVTSARVNVGHAQLSVGQV